MEGNLKDSSKNVLKIKIPKSWSEVRDLCFDETGKVFMCVCDDGSVWRFDVKKQCLIESFNLKPSYAVATPERKTGIFHIFAILQKNCEWIFRKF